MRMRLFLLGAVVGTTAALTVTAARRWYATWGIQPGDATRPLAGDDAVPNATGGETRGITIDAPPEAVWPWLLQMGYGRAGWYSYDQLDQRGRSADRLHDEWQALAVGDIVPTHPGGGFKVVAMDPGRALVLMSDTALVEAQDAAAKAARTGLDTATTGVQASGAVLSGMPRDFAASWAFVLEPLDGGRRTRLIERFRAWFGGEAQVPGSRLFMPLMGFGVFVMMQKQMEGIRDRAERLARTSPVAPIAPPATTDRQPSGAAEPVGV